MDINDLYSTKEARLNTVLSNATFWSAMRRMWDAEVGHNDIYFFQNHALTVYGIEILIDPSTNHVMPNYSIKDEDKYLFFVLKYIQ